MKNFLFILDPEEEEKDYDKSMEGFIGELAEEAGSNNFKEWKKWIPRKVREIRYPCNALDVASDIFSKLHLTEKGTYAAVGFAVGMAYAELVSQRNGEARKILDSIKRKLKKSGLLPGEKKGG
jgi:hypothetical protein